MKKKLLALFLCCVMVFSLVPMAFTTAYAAGNGLQIYGSNGAVAETVLLKMTDKTALTAVAATGSGSYQWQIHVSGDVWANIVGTNGNTLELSYALVANLLNGDTAEIRCKLTDDAGTDSYSNTVTVQIQQSTAARKAPAASPTVGTVISEAQPIGEPVIVPADAPSYYNAPAANSEPVVNDTPAADTEPAANDAPAADSEAVVNDAPAAESGDAAPADAGDPAPQDDPAPADDAPVNDAPVNDVPADETPADDTPSTYTILINYVFADGKQAAPSWSATVAAGSTYTQDIQSPVVVGYTADQLVVHVNTSEAKTYTVTYQPAEVEFTVKHYQQNVSNDEYTLADTETKKGFTESAVGEGLAKTDYTGFYSLLYDTTTKIAADGSTVVEVYYDRYYCLMNFNLDGGYGVEPIYARYGAPISVDTPTKPGYTFESWTPSIPTTMPADNTSYKANWKVGESGFTVVFWYENANKETDGSYGYSVAGTYKPADVASGTQKNSGDYKNQNFTGRDDKHFTYNDGKAETVTVKGDGSTVLNVYFTRNSYTLTFPGVDGDVLTCGKVEHSHSHAQCCTKGDNHWFSCNTKKCPVGYEHTHDSDCYGFVITAKYDSDISYVWQTDPIKSLLNQGYVFKSSVTDKYYSFLEKMPGQDITMTKTQWSGSTYEWYYYLEVPAGMSAPAGAATRTDGGKTYYLYHTVTVKGNRISLTYDEDYYPITGFTQRDRDVPDFNRNNKAYLYYTRNSYELKFINYGTTVKTETKYYQADISGEGFTPDYPETLEANAYVFDGWYTDQFFSENGKFDFTGATMPAGPVVLYAHWVPKTHTVKTYLTKDVLDNNGNPLETWEEVPHGTAIPENDRPAVPKNGEYTFVGWFYISDTGEEKAFDFSMPVNRDLNLYAKWSSKTLMEYTIRYELEDGTEIAPPTTGSALAGTTKTFDAKTGTQLNEGYQSGYFPKVSSHSITMDIEDASKNEFTFVYVAKEEVEYTVKYLEKGTEKQLAEPKTVTTRDAVVTETFEQIKGYAPDAYQKQLVLAAEGNVITFWYVKDNVHAPVQVIHWTQNIEGEGYTEYQSSTNLNGVIGTKYSENPLTIPGFTYNASKSNAKGTLTAAGLVLNLYYDRIEYPYEFRFVEKDSDTEKQLADSVTGSARYQAQVTQTAKTIPGYTLVSAENQAINIAIEDGETAVKNVKIFYYTEQTVDIKYVVVGPDGCGTLDNYQDVQLKVTTGEVKGSAPTAAEGFKIVGWYKDEDCTQPVDADWVKDSKLTPVKTKNYGTAEKPVMGYEAATYYAKFEYDVADLTITKQGWEGIDEGQSFIFTITGPEGYSNQVVIKGNGSVTIKGLKIGEYTIHEESGWSWRYSCADQKVTLKGGADVINSVTMSNSRGNDKWLDNSASADNIFTGAK